VNVSTTTTPKKPIGVLEALVRAFDRVTTSPALILPPLLLDLFLWFGPQLHVSALFESLVKAITLPAAQDASLAEQVAALQAALLETGQRMNLLGTLRAFPIGIPSLMSARFPQETPLGAPPMFEVQNTLAILGVCLGALLLGLGMGALYHLWIARRVAGQVTPHNGWPALARFLLLALILYAALSLFSVVSLFIASLLALFTPFLGVLAVFGAMSLLFMLVMYLFFTPHGIVRYGLGISRAMLESAALIRGDLVNAVSFLGGILLVSVLANQVWQLPADGSWYCLLAVLGHAFVSCVLLVATYIYYQNRREWALRKRMDLAGLSGAGQPPLPKA
jgi:hypothetical protein